MRNQMYNAASQAPSRSCCLIFNPGHSAARYSDASFFKSDVSICGFQAFQRIDSGSGFCKRRGHYIKVEYSVGPSGSQEICFNVSSGCQSTTVRLSAPKWKMLPYFKCSVTKGYWSEVCFSAALLVGSFICYSTSNPAHAGAPQYEERNDAVYLSHGKRVHKDYSVIGIPGDGRCLFRSVAHGACLISGVPAPSETIQRELADELRARVANEFIRRRKETECSTQPKEFSMGMPIGTPLPPSRTPPNEIKWKFKEILEECK